MPEMGEFPWQVRNILMKVHDSVRAMSHEAAQKMKLYYDRYASVAPFKEGDKVFLYDKARKTGEMQKLRRMLEYERIKTR